jgi:hypothetical protein
MVLGVGPRETGSPEKHICFRTVSTTVSDDSVSNANGNKGVGSNEATITAVTQRKLVFDVVPICFATGRTFSRDRCSTHSRSLKVNDYMSWGEDSDSPTE